MEFVIDNIVVVFMMAGLIIIGLSGYAVLLMLKVKRQQEAKSRAINERIDNIDVSIKTICDATIQQQCSISEATIRIITLLQVHPMLAGKYDHQLQQMNKFYNEIEHHPILENRKNTPKKVLFKLDSQREQLETDYESTILKELKWLQSTCR